MAVLYDIVQVNLAERSYPIVIGSGLFKNSELMQEYIPNKQLCFVSNETVAPLYLAQVLSNFSARKTINISLPDGEQFKTLATLEKIFDKLLSEKFDRAAALCSLSGGVVCDMTGFAAACYRRGIDFIQIPTTLLAQVDAAVGGKTAVNHPLGKNMIGAFYQPKAVLIDVDTLKTLPEREYKAGLAEVLKYGFIKDAEFLNWLLKNRGAILARDPNALIKIIKRSCEIKAAVVSADEREQGERALLNFGHTFGHALESATNYKTWLHGEAVAIGMVAASFLSYKLGMIDKKDHEKLVKTIDDFGLPITQNQAVAADVLKDYLLQDKKVLDSTVRLILLKSLGQAIISTDFSEQALEETLGQM